MRSLPTWISALIVAGLFLIAVGFAAAAPPENADPALAPWFRSLSQPDTGISCCSLADCRPVEARIASKGWQIRVGDRWLDVPPGKILRGKTNPTGKPVACVLNDQVLCFVPGIMA